MRLARDVASLTYRWQIPLFAQLNANVQFQELDRSFKGPRFDERSQLYEWLSQSLGQVAIDYLEFGVYRGETLRAWSRLNSNPESRLFGFDSFEGLPEDWRPGKRRGIFKTEPPEIQDGRCRLIKGLFQETLYPFMDEFQPHGQLIVHIDADLYSSALFCLAVMNRRLTPGSIVIFDEFYDLMNEFAAFRDWSRAFYKRCAILACTQRCAQVALSVVEGNGRAEQRGGAQGLRSASTTSCNGSHGAGFSR